MIKAWCADVTEYEAGWGSRSDGWVIAKTYQDLKAIEEDFRESGTYELFYRMDNYQEVLLEDDEYFNNIKRDGIWTDNKPVMYRVV